MSAERMPQAEPSLLAHPLGLATKLVLRHPWIVVISAIVLGLISIGTASQFLGFRARRLDLLNPASRYNKRWISYLEEFGDDDDVVIVVESEQPAKVIEVLEELAEVISRDRRSFHALLHKIDLGAVREKGLHFLNTEQLVRIENFLAQIDPVVRGDWSALRVDKQIQMTNLQLDAHAQTASHAAAGQAAAHRTTALVDRVSAALGQDSAYQLPWPDVAPLGAALSPLKSKYLTSQSGQLGMLLIRIHRSDDQFAQGNEGIDQVRRLIDEVQTQHSDVTIGLTGMPVLENDEMRASQQDMARASLLSLFGVACLFIAGFGGLRYPMMTVATLIIAIAWSFGYITVAIGHLNILSVAFSVILIGLGIDFGIHYVARYLQHRRLTEDSQTALVKTAIGVGPGIVTGGLTTALAFSTAALTDFTGVAELGLIAGGGILLCIAAALLVLPAMIHLSDRQRALDRVPALIPLDLALRPLLRLPRSMFLLGLIVTAAMAGGLTWLRYDHNLLNLQPAQLESVHWEKRLVANSEHSVWYAISMAENPARLRQLKEKFEQLESVDHTEEIVSFLPDSSENKAEIIRRISQRLAGIPSSSPVLPVASQRQLDNELAATQRRLAQLAPAEVVSSVAGLRQRLKQLSPRAYYERVSKHQQLVCGQLLAHLQSLAAIANPEPPVLSDLPEGLRTRFISKNNRHLLKIYSKADIWDMDELKGFVAQLESVDPHVTGHPVQTFYASRQMQISYVHAAIYCLLAVAIVLMLDFRNIRLTLLAMLPMGLGAVQLFGLLGLLNIPLNAANMIVLPLILGIGIDDGVHVVHDFRRQTGRYTLSRSTATAILITSATTMVGFGMMMFANHQGLRSLGQILTIGVFCCLGTSIVILPALLAWLTQHRTENGQEDESVSVTQSSSAVQETVAGDQHQTWQDSPSVIRRWTKESTVRETTR